MQYRVQPVLQKQSWMRVRTPCFLQKDSKNRLSERKEKNERILDAPDECCSDRRGDIGI